MAKSTIKIPDNSIVIPVGQAINIELTDSKVSIDETGTFTVSFKLDKQIAKFPPSGVGQPLPAGKFIVSNVNNLANQDIKIAGTQQQINFSGTSTDNLVALQINFSIAGSDVKQKSAN